MIVENCTLQTYLSILNFIFYKKGKYALAQSHYRTELPGNFIIFSHYQLNLYFQETVSSLLKFSVFFLASDIGENLGKWNNLTESLRELQVDF